MGKKDINDNGIKGEKICGLDPGLYRTGYGIIGVDEARGIRVIDAGIIETNKSALLIERLEQIYQELMGLFDEYELGNVAVESLYSHYKHPRTAILMGHARGVILLAAKRHNIPVADFSATQIKKSITGNGRASKVQIQRAVINRLGLYNIPQKDFPPDVTDALAVAICCYEHSRGIEY